MNPILTIPFEAEAAIGAYHIVKPGTSQGQAVLAAANSDGLIGVAGALGVDASDTIDVHMAGVGEVVLGGNVARGEYITADASGHGVKLTDTMLQSGACNSIGVCLKAGASGDVVTLLIIPQKVSKFDAVTASAAEINILDNATLSTAELNILTGMTATAAELNLLDDQLATASIGVGAEGTNTIDLTIQLKKASGSDLAARASIFAYLSDDSAGDSVVATAPSSGWAIKTDGLLIPVVAGKAAQLVSESDGDIDITITETGTKTMYCILVMPNGKLVASGAITFAA